MRRFAITVAATVLMTAPAWSQKAAKPVAKPEASLVLMPSGNSVKETIDKLAAAAESKGAKVVARVDHAKGAASVGVTMKPSEVLIFGNPKLGTAVMQANPRAGLDLPLKVLAYEDDAGKVWIAYPKASHLRSRYRLDGRPEQDASFKAIADALDGLTKAAAAK